MRHAVSYGREDLMGLARAINSSSASNVVNRIQEALDHAVSAIAPLISEPGKVDFKSGDDPVTEADRVINGILYERLVRDGEGWLSEENADDLGRLERKHIWVVDPLDGTREFVAGIPEWCISVGFIENGKAVAGGICNPATGEMFLGSLERGVTYNGSTARCTRQESLTGATVLASRSEVKRGEWQQFEECSFKVDPKGSVAYKLALVAAGLADATWTLCPKHEWDVAAGTALVTAAGGFVKKLDGTAVTFNNPPCVLPGLLAGASLLNPELPLFLDESRRRNGSARKPLRSSL